MPVADFEAQLQRLLARGFRAATAEEVMRRPDDARLLHVTFDDAFASVANAVPILTALGVPATVFVCTDFATGGKPLRVSELEGITQVDELTTLAWDALRALARDGRGIEIGSHSATHAHLTRLSDEELRRELTESKAAIEGNVGCHCAFLAYPYGEHDARVRDAARAAGYTAGFAAPGTSIPADRFRVPRTGFWRGESRFRQAAKTRLPVRVARERGLTPTRVSPR